MIITLSYGVHWQEPFGRRSVKFGSSRLKTFSIRQGKSGCSIFWEAHEVMSAAGLFFFSGEHGTIEITLCMVMAKHP
jgi:hypothetical protein